MQCRGMLEGAPEGLEDKQILLVLRGFMRQFEQRILTCRGLSVYS